MNPYQDFLDRLQAAASAEERARITLQFNLSNQSKVVRDAVQAAAVLHWFDHDMLNFVLETQLTNDEFTTLVSLPYVEAFPERGWNVHEKTRDMLCDKLWHEDVSLYRKLSRRAATWRRKYNPADLVWRAEATNHSLLAGERNSEQAFISLSIEWLNHNQYDVLEFLIRPVLKTIQADRLTGRVAAWALFFGARIDYIFGRKLAAKEALIQALEINTKDDFLIVNCVMTLGDVYRTIEELPLARKYYETAQSKLRALKFHLGEANCIHSLGLVHLALSEVTQAIACNESAMRIYRSLKHNLGIANCLHARGSINSFASKFSQAKDDYVQALKMYGGMQNQLGEANCTRSLAVLASDEGESDAALTYFDDAIQRFEDLGMASETARCYNDRGSFYSYLLRFHDSIASYTSAIEISEEVSFFTNRAEPNMHLGDFNAAKNDLDAAAAINPNYYYLQFNYGRFDLWTGRPQSALNFFDLAMEQRPQYGEFHLWRALALFLNGAAWEEKLQTGLALTYLARQIKEVADALEKLSPIYGGKQIDGFRAIVQTDLAARISAIHK